MCRQINDSYRPLKNTDKEALVETDEVKHHCQKTSQIIWPKNKMCRLLDDSCHPPKDNSFKYILLLYCRAHFINATFLAY